MHEFSGFDYSIQTFKDITCQKESEVRIYTEFIWFNCQTFLQLKSNFNCISETTCISKTKALQYTQNKKTF